MTMKTRANQKLRLEKRFKKVLRTPASFAFFVAIHDFVQHIEFSPSLAASLSHKTKINQDAKLPAKYASLRRIYQGIHDATTKTSEDLGHERYMTVYDLKLIQNDEVSENNAFWKKRETFRKLTAEVYERLTINLSETKN